MTIDDKALIDKIETHAGLINPLILSDREIHRGKEILCDDERILSELELEINALIAKWNGKQERVTKFRVALAPHKRIPQELLSDIFLHCLPADTIDSVISIPPQLSQAPSVLGQVCSLWREVSRNDYRLWGRAIMNMDDENHRWNLTRICDTLPPQIALSLRVEAYVGHVEVVRRILVPHLWRVQTLNLVMYIEGYDELWRIASPESFMALQSADLHFMDRTDQDSGQWSSKWDGAQPFRLARNLKNLTLTSPKISFPALLALDIPWSQLTSLDITACDSLSANTTFQVLQKCSSLETLYVKFEYDDVTADIGQLVIPVLRSLIVRIIVPSALIDGKHLWGNLSTLDLQYVEFEDARELRSIIKQCTCLTQLLATVPPKGSADMNDRDLPLPHLTTLNLEVHDNWIFRSLVTPALTDLFLFFVIEPELSLVSDTIVTSGCTISSLRLSYLKGHPRKHIHSPDLRDLLVVIPAAVNFASVHVITDDKILRDISRGILLPRLKYLSCSPASLEAFFDMLEVRLEREFQKIFPTVRKLSGLWPPDIQDQAIKDRAKSRLEVIRRTYEIECDLR